jgi:hypothetical protein
MTGVFQRTLWLGIAERCDNTSHQVRNRAHHQKVKRLAKDMSHGLLVRCVQQPYNNYIAREKPQKRAAFGANLLNLSRMTIMFEGKDQLTPPCAIPLPEIVDLP